jgi:hypothetical protein
MSDVPPEETPTTPPGLDTSSAPANATPPPAGGEPNYYDILGVPPTADAATIEAAYSSRSLRFRIGQLRERAQPMSGPTKDEVEHAFAVLSDPEARARYDAAYFPEQAPPPVRPRRRIPVQVWLVAAIWLAVLAGVIYAGFQLRAKPAASAITAIVNATVTSAPNSAGATSAVVAIASPVATATATTVPATSAPSVAPTAAPPTATATAPPPTATPPPTAPPSPSAAPTVNPGQAIFRPTETPAGQPVAPTAAPLATPPPAAPVPTTAPPTAPLAPTATPVPPPPPTPTPEPPPPPPPAPAFAATDRIGTALPVNFRTGPGIEYASQGGLPQGTLLAATGRSAYAGGYLWREFDLADGRRGWVRDIDVLPVR